MEKEKKSRPVGSAARTGRDNNTPDLFAGETSSERPGDEADEDGILDLVPIGLSNVALIDPAAVPLDELPDDVRASTRRIRALMMEVKEKICEIGGHLNEVKEQLEPGQWLKWLEAHCQLSERTAQRYMAAADALEGVYERLASQPSGVIYAFSAKSTPFEAREAILARADAGEQLEVKEARRIIREHTLPELERKDPEKKKTADERPQWDRAESSARIEKARQEQQEAARRAVALVAEMLGDRREEFREALAVAHPRFGEEAYVFFVIEPERQAQLEAERGDTDDA
jgi:hypothetical protein